MKGHYTAAIGRQAVVVGLLAGLATGALWALTFIAPLVSGPYSAFDLTVCRYVTFGMVSLMLVAPEGFAALRRLSRADYQVLVLLGFTGNVGYYLALSLAVPLVGPAAVALVVGCLPVLMAVLGCRTTGLPLGRLMPALAFILLGLALVNGVALLQARAAGGVGGPLWGLLLAVGAMVLWAWYGMRNAAELAARPAVSPVTWTALTGIGTMIALLPLVVIGWLAHWSAVPAIGLAHGAWLRPVAAGLVLGLLSSWAGTWTWSIAARALPVSMAGQLIVFETIFALVYSAMYVRQLPSWPELAGALMLVAGVAMALRVFAAGTAGIPDP
ncbi:DMT family transporter [Gluconacetobacter azotocaptans]|uniref:DMT family transporter n=1 Tax=Gluconacetobacter azotocaptans TaxID=142834 RepID=A0A7W4JUR5_9PROT|nr:DMT family transporter [Gluconacetobacter azotocaptans]MBB2191197.1 DMT family transporter [Gluconacetobacter azotocaptans]GBQ36519.1 drug/metabolite transporter superfamily permease [Gluconacetobacter azotocaptans DSM 13594]